MSARRRSTTSGSTASASSVDDVPMAAPVPKGKASRKRVAAASDVTDSDSDATTGTTTLALPPSSAAATNAAAPAPKQKKQRTAKPKAAETTTQQEDDAQTPDGSAPDAAAAPLQKPKAPRKRSATAGAGKKRTTAAATFADSSAAAAGDGDGGVASAGDATKPTAVFGFESFLTNPKSIGEATAADLGFVKGCITGMGLAQFKNALRALAKLTKNMGRVTRKVDKEATYAKYVERLRTIPQADFAVLNGKWLSAFGLEGAPAEKGYFTSAEVDDGIATKFWKDGAYNFIFALFDVARELGATPAGIVGANRKSGGTKAYQYALPVDEEVNRIYVGSRLAFKKRDPTYEPSIFAPIPKDTVPVAKPKRGGAKAAATIVDDDGDVLEAQ